MAVCRHRTVSPNPVLVNYESLWKCNGACPTLECVAHVQGLNHFEGLATFEGLAPWAEFLNASFPTIFEYMF